MELIKVQKGYLTILTGKTDMGKSTITVYECSENLRNGQKVIFFSYEYCQSIICNKLVSHFNCGWSQMLNLNIVDASNISLNSLVAYAKAKKDNVDIIYVDYLDLLKNATYPKAQSEAEDFEQIKEICKALAKLAKELDVPVVLLSQIGASSDFEKAVARLNAFSETVKDKNVIKMFIGKGNIIDTRIDFSDITQIILVDGYNLKLFSSLNIKEIYGDR